MCAVGDRREEPLAAGAYGSWERIDQHRLHYLFLRKEINRLMEGKNGKGEKAEEISVF